jgi:hypothetical protein
MFLFDLKTWLGFQEPRVVKNSKATESEANLHRPH